MRPKRWWIGTTAGAALILVGLVGIATHAGATRPVALTEWTLGAAVVHDALVAPAVAVVGLVTARWLPVALRVPIRVGLALSALVVALAWPFVRGYGRRASNPSALPFEYGRNLVILLAVIWTGVVLGLTGATIRRRRS